MKRSPSSSQLVTSQRMSLSIDGYLYTFQFRLCAFHCELMLLRELAHSNAISGLALNTLLSLYLSSFNCTGRYNARFRGTALSLCAGPGLPEIRSLVTLLRQTQHIIPA